MGMGRRKRGGRLNILGDAEGKEIQVEAIQMGNEKGWDMDERMR